MHKAAPTAASLPAAISTFATETPAAAAKSINCR